MDVMIDHALRDDEIKPAASFRDDVMRRLQSEIETPPLAFPWRLALVSAIAGAAIGVFLQF